MTRDFERRLRELERRVNGAERLQIIFDWSLEPAEPEDPNTVVFEWGDYFTTLRDGTGGDDVHHQAEN